MKTTSPEGRADIAMREGTKLVAYLDSGGVLTIGTGHTSAAGPPTVKRGMKITAAESDAILARDLADVEKAVNDAVKVPISQDEFDALVSLTFNIGATAFCKSTLLRKLNAGDRAGAAQAFLSWNKDKDPKTGKLVAVKGLTIRRQAERAQFLRTAPPVIVPSVFAPVAQLDPANVTLEPEELVPDPGPTKTSIAFAQKYLSDLGYNPGGQDGRLGPLTRGAILAFRNDHGLPLTADIDGQFLAMLTVAKPRVMAPARATATTQEVAAKVPEVKANLWTRIAAKWTAYTTLGAGAVKGTLDNIAPAKAYIAPLQDTFASIPVYVWLGLIGIAAGGLYYVARHGVKEGVAAFQSGDRR